MKNRSISQTHILVYPSQSILIEELQFGGLNTTVKLKEYLHKIIVHP